MVIKDTQLYNTILYTMSKGNVNLIISNLYIVNSIIYSCLDPGQIKYLFESSILHIENIYVHKSRIIDVGLFEMLFDVDTLSYP